MYVKLFFVVFSAVVLAIIVMFVVMSQLLQFKETKLRQFIATRDETLLGKRFIAEVEKSLDGIDSREELERIIVNADYRYDCQKRFGTSGNGYWEMRSLAEILLKAQLAQERLDRM